MPDVNDPLLKRIAKAAKVSAPKLSDRLITESITRPRSSRTPRLVFASTSLAAALVVGLVMVGVFGKPAITQVNGPLFSMAKVDSMSAYGSAMTSDQNEFIAGPNLTDSSGTGHVYELRRTGDPISTLEKLAGVFGLQGEIAKSESGQGVNEYLFSNEKALGQPTIRVQWQGTGTWNVDFFEPGRLGERRDFLSDEKLRLNAKEVFSKTGLNVNVSDLEIYKDRGRRVIGYLELNGQKTALQWEIDWDERGNLKSVRGHSIEVIDRGNFETISQQAAVKRIQDNRYRGTVRNPGAGRNWEAILKNTDNSKLITIDDAVNTLMLVWDLSGNAWLTPGYVFQNDQTAFWPIVISLKDGIIKLPKKRDDFY